MLCESGFTQNTCTMGHTGTLTVRPQSPQKESKTQVENALFALKDFFSRRKTAVLLGLFREHDANCSGRLELCEFKSAIRQLNLDLGDESMTAVFAFFDRDGTGEVEVAEFLNHMLGEADPTATRFERVGIGRSYLAPNSEAPNGDGVLPTNGESGYARDGVVAMRPGSTISPSIPDDVAHYTMTPTVEKVLGTLKEYFSIRPVSHIVDLFRMCGRAHRPSSLLTS